MNVGVRRNRTQEKSYPNWMGTISPEKSYPFKSYPREIVPKLNGYDFTRDIVPRVRFLQRYRTLFIQYYFVVYCTVEKYTYALFKFIKYFKTCKYFSSKVMVHNIRYIKSQYRNWIQTCKQKFNGLTCTCLCNIIATLWSCRFIDKYLKKWIFLWNWHLFF